MDVTVPIADLKKLLTSAKRVTPRSGPLSCSRGTRLTAAGGTLTIEATDLAITLTSSLPANVRSEGVAVVPLTDLANHVSGKGSIDLTLVDKSLRAVNGTTSTLRVMPAEEWPVKPLPDFSGVTAYPLDLAAIADLAVAASTDETRPILGGVLFDGREICATDSYRIHLLRSSTVAYPAAALVPAKALLLAAKLGAEGTLQVATLVRMVKAVKTNGRPRFLTHPKRKENPDFREWTVDEEITELHARITVAGQVFHTLCIEGGYPNYRQLIPTNYPGSITLDRDTFISVVQAVKPMAKFSPIRLMLQGDELLVEARAHDVGENSGTLPVKVTGDFPTLIAFNPEFLLDALRTLSGEKVTLTAIDGLKPALLQEQLYRWETRPGTRGRKQTKVGTLLGESIRLLMPVRAS